MRRARAQVIVGAEAGPRGVVLDAAGVLDRRVVDPRAAGQRRSGAQERKNAADADSSPLQAP
ncbi:MAG TPA: hypothetical protein VIJ51_15130 [Solirubrobacteraceae bacterium]